MFDEVDRRESRHGGAGRGADRDDGRGRQSRRRREIPRLEGPVGRHQSRASAARPSSSIPPRRGDAKAQQAPLTPEYQKVHEASMADQAKGGLGNYPTAHCLPGGMPRIMALPDGQEYVVTPDTTYTILVGHEIRRIFTDADRTLAGRPTPTRPTRAIRSAGGSIPTTTAATTPSRSRPAAIQGAARTPTTPPGCAARLRQRVRLQGAVPSRQGRFEPPP